MNQVIQSCFTPWNRDENFLLHALSWVFSSLYHLLGKLKTSWEWGFHISTCFHWSNLWTHAWEQSGNFKFIWCLPTQNIVAVLKDLFICIILLWNFKILFIQKVAQRSSVAWEAYKWTKPKLHLLAEVYMVMFQECCWYRPLLKMSVILVII